MNCFLTEVERCWLVAVDLSTVRFVWWIISRAIAVYPFTAVIACERRWTCISVDLPYGVEVMQEEVEVHRCR
jgi:hypothetical protein